VTVHLHTPEAIAAQRRVHERMHLRELAASGYFFCQSCERVTEDLGELLPKCCHCGSCRLRWNPPVLELR
jgi:hypothetical protein